MRKIPTLFKRNPDDRRHVLPEVNEGCAWVLAGEGKATRKWDGTCCMLDEDGHWWARREVKPGKTPPPNFMPLSTDPATGKTVGWEPIGQSPFAKFHAEAPVNCGGVEGADTFELIGPKINGNPDDFDMHVLMPHGWSRLSERLEFEKAPRDFDGLRDWLQAHPQYEGIVWWHDDGRMVKLKRRDFPAAEETP